jgi:curved DNA-binding protein
MVLGGEVRVPTPDGRNLALNIPAGTQDGRTFRLRGQGMPKLGRTGQRGDLHAEVHVHLPEHLTPRQRELFEEFVRAGEREGVGSR